MNRRHFLLVLVLGMPLAVPSAHAQDNTVPQPFQRAADRIPAAQPSVLSAAARADGGNVQLVERQVDIYFFGEGHAAKSVYSYEQRRRVMEEQFVMDDMLDWQPESRIHFQHLEGSIRVPGTIEQWDAQAPGYVNASRYQYEYFTHIPSGVYLSQTVEQTWTGGGWTDVSRSTNTYGDCSLAWCPLQTATEEVMVDGSWLPVERFTWDDVPGSGSMMTEQAWDDGGWVNLTRAIFEADISAVQMTLADIAYFSDDTGTLLLHLEMPDHLVQEWDGESWINSTRQTSTITEQNGKRVQYAVLIERYHSDGNSTSWEEAAQLTKLYDEAGMPASLVIEDLEEEEAFLYIERYTFGEDLRLQEATVSQGLGDEEFLMLRYTFDWQDLPVSIDAPALPVSLTLEPAYPNPFGATATLSYRMSDAGAFTARVFDMLGREVATLYDGYQTAGTHSLTIDASWLAAGTYVVRVQAGDQVQVRKVTVER